MLKQQLPISTVLSLGATSIATAHPGHGADGGSDSLWHYLTEPIHLAAGLFAFLAMVAIVRLATAWLWKKEQSSEAEET